MSRTTWRALGTELLRSAAPFAALATLVAGAAMLYSDSTSWAGQWMPLAAAVRTGMYVTGALALAAGAWQSGRERRRDITEQVDATPRPAWQPVLVAWVSVTLGCSLGLLLAITAGAVLVAPIATYAGGGWSWLIVVAFVALATLSALGVALGRLVPSRLIGPVVAIVFSALMIYTHDGGESMGNAQWLAPIVRTYEAFGNTLPVSVHVHQIIWFSGLAAGFLVLAAARRRVYVLIPAAVATTGAALLIATQAEGFFGRKWEPDLAAQELVCVDGTNDVCLPRAEAFLLDDVAPFAREVLDRLEGVPGGPSRALNRYFWSSPEENVVTLNTWPTITGELHPDETWMVVHWNPQHSCGPDVGEDDHHRIIELATMWAVDDPWGNPEAERALNALRALPEADQKAWVGDVIAAAESCDTEALDSLREQLP